MKNFLSETKFTILILVIISVVSGISNFDIESEQILNEKKEDQDLSLLDLNNTLKANRGLASVEENKSQLVEQTFFCNHSLDEKKYHTNNESNLIMLSFKLCKDLKIIESVSLFNATNGFKAQIFKSSNSNYKTDYIQLNNGSNKIVVEVVLKDGQKNQDSLVILTGS